jgi:hypothetical protein
MHCFKYRGFVYVLIVAFFVLCSAMCSRVGYANENVNLPVEESPLVVEIERLLPNGQMVVLTRTFGEPVELLWWFQEKVNKGGCDPAVEKVTLFPKGYK